MSKVLEKVVLSQILQHVNSNKLLSDFQSAYRPYHSTETALLKVTHDLLSAMDDGTISELVLLDLSTTFDTIVHEILLHCLHHEFKLLLYMVNTRHQFLFIMVYHRDQFLYQYVLFYIYSPYQMS